LRVLFLNLKVLWFKSVVQHFNKVKCCVIEINYEQIVNKINCEQFVNLIKKLLQFDL
jgi:hypothetical protein